MDPIEQLQRLEIPALVHTVSLQLTTRQWSMCTAESCTGGMIAAACTDLAGSSDWFERGIVSYSNAAKCELLDVPAATIATHGAVSSAVAEAMARGALSHAHAQVAVAVTGVAGPSGGSAAKPVGTVWFAWALPGATWTSMQRFDGDRHAVRVQTVAHALRELGRTLQQR